jgi:hypothetical protein
MGARQGAAPSVVPKAVVPKAPPRTAPPDKLAECASPPLAGATGAWLADWLEDPGHPNLIPAQAKQLGLLDFYWVRLGASPGTLLFQPDDPTAESLGTALSAAAAANPCGLRFITVSDDRTPKSVMAKILADPQARQQNIAALTALMARYPQADGLTLDYEYALPSSKADLATYAAASNWHGLTDSEEVARITARSGYATQLVMSPPAVTVKTLTKTRARKAISHPAVIRR